MPTPAVNTIDAVRHQVREARRRGLSIGLVPTMGALHEGHASLFRLARAETGFVVATIFINPTQFGPNEDFSKYPRTLEADLEICGRDGVDLVFHPDPSTIYPPDFRTYVEVTQLQDFLCGASRPGHFRGVATVVLKLFNIVQPDVAYFGQKDAQQVRIIQQLAADLDVPVKIRVGAIVREPDGLALSSRNRYLDPSQRRQALALIETLREAQRRIEAGERDGRSIQRTMQARIETTPDAVLDYAAVVDANSLQPLERLHGEVLLALAVKFGGTRLIDNLLVTV
ncbi:MAG: pantoate--beta-alanine ligase [Gemmataceae bacterium]|nr:pantoate--beta-alanine ligase [Gemmataceae bacterium]